MPLWPCVVTVRPTVDLVTSLSYSCGFSGFTVYTTILACVQSHHMNIIILKAMGGPTVGLFVTKRSHDRVEYSPLIMSYCKNTSLKYS